MRKLILITLAIIVSINCKAQTKQDSILIEMQRDNVTLIGFTIEGMKEIRHDALCRLKFKYAHYMNTEIRKEEQILKELTDMLQQVQQAHDRTKLDFCKNMWQKDIVALKRVIALFTKIETT